MTTITARTVLRSRNASAPDRVLSTLLLRYPRFIHAEVMTHRAFSRNAASSRAIPVARMIDDILADTAMPLHWGKNQKGMQAESEFDGFEGYVRNPWHNGQTPRGSILSPQQAWTAARDKAIDMARSFEATGYHKQVVNRLLEPFMHITVLVSATEWGNFLELRDHEDAEPHIAMLAREVRACLDDESTVQTLQPGEWHLPFVGNEDWEGIPHQGPFGTDAELALARKLSVARCASTSYRTVDGFDMTLDRAVALHDKLVGARPQHASPCEHVAQVDGWDDGEPGSYAPHWPNASQHGNFTGFRQYRHKLETEVSP